MAASIIFFLLSVTINIVILLVFKKLDDDKKSLSKVARYCQKFKEDIDNDYNEKMTKIKDFNTCLDTSLQKGGRILNQLSNITSAYDSDSGKMSVSPELLKRISNMESKLSEMEDKSYSSAGVKMSGGSTGSRELYSQLSGLRKEVSAMMKELEKKKKEANDSYRLFDSRMKSEMEAKKNNILEFIKLQENQFNENEKKFQKELDRIDSDIAKMNKNFIKDASQNFTLLNQDYRMKFEDLSKKYADMDAEYSKKLETKIKDCSEYITRIEGRCTSLEDQIIKELEKAKEEYILDLAAKFTTEKSDISKFGEQLKTNAKAYILKTIKDNEEKSKSISETFKKNEMQAQVTLKRYEDFLKDSAERLESSKNEFINSLEQKVADFNSHLDTSKQMGIKLELEIFTEIKTKLETFRRESEKNIDALRNKLDSDIANYDKQISSKYSSIKEDYSKAALDYNELTTKYEKFTDTFSKTVESNRKALEDQENAVNEKAAALKKAIETGLVKWNETFNAEKQRIEDLFETDKKAFDEKRDKAADEMTETIAEYESMMNQSVENVKVHFEEQRSKIFAEIDSIVAQIESNAAGKTGEISSKFDKTYSDFENKLSGIQDNMLQKASDIEQMLLAKSDEINAHLVEEMDTFKKSVSDRSTQFESEINQENEAIIVRVNTFKDDVRKMIDDEKAQVGQDIAAMKSDFSTAETAINDKLHNIETLYYDKGVQLLETNKTELSGYSQRFEQLSGNINELQKTIEDKLYNLVSDGTKQIDDLFEQGKASLTEKYNALSAETSKQIDEHKNDLTKIRKTISELDTTYDTKFNDKIDMFTTQFGTKLDKFNEEFKLNISQITEDAKKYENNFITQIDALKKQITDDYETFSAESSGKFDILRNDYTNLNDNLTQMKLKIDQDVGAKIAEGKKKLDDEYAILHEELNNMYLQEIDDARKKYEQTRAELDRSLADYKKDAAAMSQNLKFTDKEYTSKYMEHSSFLDKKINQIKVNMDEFEKKTKIFDKAFDLKNQLTSDMEELKDTIRSLRSDKERINDIEKQIRDIEILAKSTLDKSSSINAERKKIDNMSVLLTQLKNQVDETTDKFSELKIQGDIAERLNEKIAATNERYEKMEKVFRSLDETEQNIKTVSTQMDIISQNFENYSHRADAFEHRLTDLDGKRETYQKKFESFEKDSKLILQSEQDINDVREQFKQLDILQQSLTRRQDEVNRLTTKVNDAMVKYGKIDMETDNKIRVLEALLRDANDTPMMKNVIENDDDRRTAIIKLKKQGFTIDEIANSLHITRQEAQMQLDLGDESDRRGF